MEQSKTNNGIKYVWLLVFFFLVKSLVLSFWITPLWDVPDETGHYAYIQDIAEGKGIPVLGESVISTEIVNVWMLEPEPPPYVTNWIAQHPPGYYLVGALFLKTAGLLTDDPYWLYRAPRVLSSLSAAFALFVFFLIFRLVTKDYKFSLVATACISFIPMYSHMSSGTNHDIFLVLLVAVAVFFWCRYLLHSNYKDAILMGLFLSFAGFTKITALAVALPMLVISFIHINGNSVRAGRICLLILVSAVFPGAWMYRNLKLFGNLMPDVTSIDKISGINHFDKLSSKLSVGIIEYLQSNQIFEGTLCSFFGVFGWTGSGGGNTLMFGVGSPFIYLYVVVALIGLLYSYVWLLKKAYDLKQYFYIYVSVIVILLYSFIIMPGFDKLGLEMFSAIFVGMLPFSFLFLNVKVLPNEKIIYCSLAVIAVFLGAYIFKLREGFEAFGVARAVSGRYWFPLIPCIVMSFIYPTYLLLRTRTFKYLRLYDWVLFAIVLIFATTEMLFYTNKAIPFFQGAF